MININVKDLNNEIVKMDNLIDDYNDVYLNLFNSINFLQNYWKGSTADRYFYNVIEEKVETEKLLNEIKLQYNIYLYIYDNYKNIGNKIRCNLDSKETIINKINNCIEKTKEIINMYTVIIDDYNDYEEKNRLIKLKDRMKNVLSKYETSKKTIKETYGKIEDIEQEINKKLAKIDFMFIEDE